MDDGIELNFAAPSAVAGVKRQLKPKKGGRWTERVKAQQAVRRVVKKYEANQVASVEATNQATRAAAPRPHASSAPTHAPVPTSTPRQSAPVARPSAPKQAAVASNRAPVSRPAASAHKSTTKSVPSSSTVAGPSRIPIDDDFEVEMPPPLPTAPATSKTTGGQIISSLFTSNPSIPTSTRGPNAVPGAASNAPLKGDTSTFTGLGVDPLIAHHLKNKMHIDAPTAIQKACLPYMVSNPVDVDGTRDEEDEQVEGSAKQEEGAGLRDVFIQSQTGSGKTLSYLIPIIQSILPLSRLSYIDRTIGTLAIIMAPTRELAQQISKVVEKILTMSLSLPGEDDHRHYTRWITSGLLMGGNTRNHEKKLLRKGVPILVSTPGRLRDHLQNTTSFQCSKTMFLVLDEADRLMDSGFEEAITGIIKALNGRRSNEIRAEKEQDEEGGGLMRWPYWNRGRQTILCSATVDSKVERLAGSTLRDPIVFRPTDIDAPKDVTTETVQSAAVAEALAAASAVTIPKETGEKFTPPSQLSQKYLVVPTKLRLVTLSLLLSSLVKSARDLKEDSKDGTKVIVFLSSTDSVDYHFRLFGGFRLFSGADQGTSQQQLQSQQDESSDEESETESVDGEDSEETKKPKTKGKETKKTDLDDITLRSDLFPNTTIHRLHGSLPLRTRLASLKAFAEPSNHASILFATSVASRGLDLPLVRAVVQYDLPTEGGANEYVHRVGRTARAGKGGEAWAFLGPSEAEWVPWVEKKMAGADQEEDKEGGSVLLSQVDVTDVLKKGLQDSDVLKKRYQDRRHYQDHATGLQLDFERWVLDDEKNAALARKAFGSFVRAYSTHPLDERRFFHVKNIHLGHLAKSFALREAPAALAAKTKRVQANPVGQKKRKRGGADDSDSEEERRGGKETTARNETERRMYEAVRRQGKLVKSGGQLGAYSGGTNTIGGVSAGGGEYQVASTKDLERMVAKRR